MVRDDLRGDSGRPVDVQFHIVFKATLNEAFHVLSQMRLCAVWVAMIQGLEEVMIEKLTRRIRQVLP